MSDEKLTASLLAGAERLKQLKGWQFGTMLPHGTSVADLPLIALLAGVDAPNEEIAVELQKAAATLARLRQDSRVAELVSFGDAATILALASLEPFEAPEIPAVPLPVPPEPVPGARTAEPACSHVGADGKCWSCTGEPTADCDDCDDTFVVASGIPCRREDECGMRYCRSCAENNLNEHGYCEECETVECAGCEDTITRGTEKSCSNPDCREKEPYCDTCAGEDLNRDGLCRSCSGEDAVDCASCDRAFTASRTIACANDCGYAWCGECAAENLQGGWCQDCRENRE